MVYLLDTDTLIFYLRGRAEVREKLLSFPLTELCTSTVCFGELYYGAAKSREKDERKAEVDRLREMLSGIAPNSIEMERFGTLKANLETKGLRLADADLMIAATALEHDLILVTGNFNHFKRIRGLKLESWIER